MAYKNIEDARKYQHDYYLKFPHPLIKKTKEEKLAIKRKWYHDNLDKNKAIAKKSREKHKEQRKLDIKIWREKNKEWVRNYNKKYQKEYYLNNKEEIDEKNKLYAKTHRREMVRNVQRYVKRNKEKVIKYRKQYEKTLNGKYRQLQHRARIKGQETDITINQFREIILSPCYYCGEKEKPRGIDRVDNNQNYLLKNSVACCKICNFMKKALSKQQFLEHIEKIYKNII